RHTSSGLLLRSSRLRTLFFFSSRRRHTISKRDWSSDVCSSDLLYPCISNEAFILLAGVYFLKTSFMPHKLLCNFIALSHSWLHRSEERRVGKECTSG